MRLLSFHRKNRFSIRVTTHNFPWVSWGCLFIWSKPIIYFPFHEADWDVLQLLCLTIIWISTNLRMCPLVVVRVHNPTKRVALWININHLKSNQSTESKTLILSKIRGLFYVPVENQRCILYRLLKEGSLLYHPCWNSLGILRITNYTQVIYCSSPLHVMLMQWSLFGPPLVCIQGMPWCVNHNTYHNTSVACL